MNEKTAIVFGGLLIAGILFGIFSSVPAIEKSNYLTNLSSNKTRVRVAAFFQFAMATVYVCVAVLMYPVIKEYNNIYALGYFGFRIIGAAFLYIGIVALLLLLSISFLTTDQSNPIHIQTTGETLRAGRDLVNHIGMILPWSLGGLILYFCFFRMGIVPQWMSIAGLIATSLTLIATFLLMFDIIRIVTPVYLIMNIPTALLEFVLAAFLIMKGLNSIVPV